MEQSVTGPQIIHPAVPVARLARALRFLKAVPGWRGLVNRLLPAGASGPFAIVNEGVAFAGDLNSYIDRQLYLFGSYEAEHLADFLSSVPASGRATILDIGANVGTHSLFFSKNFAAVHAFEPNPALWAPFEKNMAMNKADNVTLHKVGLGRKDEDLTLYLTEKNNFGLGTFSTVQQYDVPLKAAAVCKVVNAGPYLAASGVERCDAIKIDVQGFEPEVIASLRGLIEASRPVVWFELGGGTQTQLRTRADVEALFPWPIRLRRMLPVKPPGGVPADDGTGAQSVLPMGDYIVTPR